MLKMLKYEFRRGIFPLLIVGIVIAAIELYFLISTLTEHADHSIIAIALLILAVTQSYVSSLLGNSMIPPQFGQRNAPLRASNRTAGRRI